MTPEPKPASSAPRSRRAVALASNLAGYLSTVYQSPLLPRRSDEVARWRRDPGSHPRIWPQSPEKSWRVELERGE